ncbi:MAG: hypothetical protein KDA84_24200 [Planctomycetaceae bacterium]|nr:hypothetical protein [Planctomycetaceae bacterium]
MIMLIVSLGMGTYRLVIRPLMNGSRYSEADRLTSELIQGMNDMAEIAEGLDVTEDLSPDMKRKMDDGAARMEVKTKRLMSLKLSNADRMKLKQKHGLALDQAKARFDRAMTNVLRRAFSQMKR